LLIKKTETVAEVEEAPAESSADTSAE